MRRVPILIPLAATAALAVLFLAADWALSHMPVGVAAGLGILLGCAVTDFWHQFCATHVTTR